MKAGQMGVIGKGPQLWGQRAYAPVSRRSAAYNGVGVKCQAKLVEGE